MELYKGKSIVKPVRGRSMPFVLHCTYLLSKSHVFCLKRKISCFIFFGFMIAPPIFPLICYDYLINVLCPY